MSEINDAYIEFLLKFRELERPLMPKFDVFAYTDSEYLNAIKDVENLFSLVDDLSVTERFLKGD